MQFLTESDVRRLAERGRAKHVLRIAAMLLARLAAFVSRRLAAGGGSVENQATAMRSMDAAFRWHWWRWRNGQGEARGR